MGATHMNKFEKAMRKIEKTMSAISFAEEGEFETARELIKEDRQVLLGIRHGEIEDRTLKYALNTCKRIGAGLDILFVSSPGATDPALERFISELQKESIKYRLVRKSGCLKQEIIEHTNARKEILFVVIESSDNLDTDCKGSHKRLSESWQNLKCPLVVVMEGA